jgi:hypothetical protein
MRSVATITTIAVIFLSPQITNAASPCPSEVKEARAVLTAKTTNAAKTTQPPKSQAAAHSQDVQAPRGQETQAPRGQDTQAPRGQDVQAPRGQDVQAPRAKDHPEPPEGPAPRSQDVQAPRNVAKGRANALANARRLVSEAETACKDADSRRALATAHAAMELLNYVE